MNKLMLSEWPLIAIANLVCLLPLYTHPSIFLSTANTANIIFLEN